jgi:hypothetical protein
MDHSEKAQASLGAPEVLPRIKTMRHLQAIRAGETKTFNTPDLITHYPYTI